VDGKIRVIVRNVGSLKFLKIPRDVGFFNFATYQNRKLTPKSRKPHYSAVWSYVCSSEHIYSLLVT